MAAYKLVGNGYVIRERDGAFVPIYSTTNRDTREYHYWLNRGGVPDPPDVRPQQPVVVSTARLRNLVDAAQNARDFAAFQAAVAGFTE